MRTAMPIPAFARGRSPKLVPPGRQTPYHFTIGKTALEARLEWLRASYPHAKIGVITSAASWVDLPET
jgi:hypothetical protein